MATTTTTTIIDKKAPTFSLESFMDIKALTKAERIFCKGHFKSLGEAKTIEEWIILCKEYGLNLD